MTVTVKNSDETCKSRPSESISPRRDETGSSPKFFARNVARAARSTFERAGNSPKREGSRLSEIPCCPCPCFWRSRLGEGEARLSEHVSPERDPSA